MTASSAPTTAVAATLPEAGRSLKQKLARAERMNKLKSQLLILPLVLFILLVFVLPITSLLFKSVNNPEVVDAMPHTVKAISSWSGRALPPEAVYAAAAQDIQQAHDDQKLGDLGKRLNMEVAGYRSLLNKTARALPIDPAPKSYKEALTNLDERWGDPAYWQAIRRNTSTQTRSTCWPPWTTAWMTWAKSAAPRRTRPFTWTSSPAPSG
jgi:putative spermidine/putrescine transport system permease protein